MRKRTPALRGALLLLTLLPAASAAGAGEIRLPYRVPPARSSDSAAGTSRPASVSADGRYTVFLSNAPNLIPGQADTNAADDVFLYDRVAETVTLVSRTDASPAAAAGRVVEPPVISADGRFVAFVSDARDLLPAQDPGSLRDVFLWDRLSGDVTLASRSRAGSGRPGNGTSGAPALSADGRYVAFVSRATDLVDRQADLNQEYDVFVYDRQSGRTTLVSRVPGGNVRTGDSPSGGPSISADGRFIAFTSSAGNLVAGQVSGSFRNVFVHDRSTGRNVLASHRSDSRTVGGNQDSFEPRISANGEAVAFASRAENLVAGQIDANGGADDLFLFHRPSGTIVLASRSASSAVRTADNSSYLHTLSADGHRVAFSSVGTDLVAGQSGAENVFLFERSTGQVTLGTPPLDGDPESFRGATLMGLSADGQRVAFLANESAYVSPPAEVPGTYVYLHDLRLERTVRAGLVSSDSFEVAVVLSADGGWLAFNSQDTGLAPGRKDLNRSLDVYLYGWNGETRELVSRRAPSLPSRTPQAESRPAGLSADGRYAVFTSTAGNLLPRVTDSNRGTSGDSSEGNDVFLYDRLLDTTTLVSHAAGAPLRAGSRSSGNPRISADGRFVVYLSEAADLVAGQIDFPQTLDLFLYDREAGTSTLLTRRPGTLEATGDAADAVINADGSTVAFVRGDFFEGQIYLYEPATGRVTLLSHAFGSETQGGNGSSSGPSLSADGRFVLFTSEAANLLPTPVELDRNGYFLHDRDSGTTTFIARSFSGYPAVLSAGGRYAAFLSEAADLVPGQIDDNDNGAFYSSDLFLYDRIAGTIQLVSHTADSPLTAAGTTVGPMALSADGRHLVFLSESELLIPSEEPLSDPRIFLFDRVSGNLEALGRANGSEIGPGPLAISPDGRYTAFLDSYRIRNPFTPHFDLNSVYLYDRQTRTAQLVSAANGVPGNDSSSGLLTVTSGGHVLFGSRASNLVPGDFNFFSGSSRVLSLSDVFLYSPVP